MRKHGLLGLSLLILIHLLLLLQERILGLIVVLLVGILRDVILYLSIFLFFFYFHLGTISWRILLLLLRLKLSLSCSLLFLSSSLICLASCRHSSWLFFLNFHSYDEISIFNFKFKKFNGFFEYVSRESLNRI